jgi:hypothetical protein
VRDDESACGSTILGDSGFGHDVGVQNLLGLGVLKTVLHGIRKGIRRAFSF